MTVVAFDDISARQLAPRGEGRFHAAEGTAVVLQFSHDGENPLLALDFVFLHHRGGNPCRGGGKLRFDCFPIPLFRRLHRAVFFVRFLVLLLRRDDLLFEFLILFVRGVDARR